MEKAVIVIPIYSEKIAEAELIALKQVDKVLKKYDKVFVAPQGLNFDYGEFCSDWKVIEFDKSFFKGTISYSELLLYVDFYEKFIAYEYMLIYQLDGFVFSDRLLEFCEYGYDYIGGPWPMNHRYSIGRKKVKIGNGGVSLRKIGAVISLLKKKDYIFEKYNLEKMFLKVEDYFFSFCGSIDELQFRVPSASMGRQFCIDLPTDLPMFLRHFSKGKIPFSLHGWNKQGCIDYCLEYINRCGYSLANEGDMYDYRKLVKTYLSLYIVDRCVRSNNVDLMNCIKKLIDKPAIIWGCGTFGIKCRQMLEFANVEVACFFDRNPSMSDMRSVKIIQPDDAIINSKNNLIIITPYAYEDAIADELADKGLCENIDYVKYSSIANTVVKTYLGLFSNK